MFVACVPPACLPSGRSLASCSPAAGARLRARLGSPALAIPGVAAGLLASVLAASTIPGGAISLGPRPEVCGRPHSRSADAGLVAEYR